jgi:transcriptional regulator with XRE-family HTH domain
VKDIRDKARAIEVYARQAKNTEAERQACEIRLRAERKAGQLSRELEKAQGHRSDLTLLDRPTKSEALSKAGISREQAAQWEQLADMKAAGKMAKGGAPYHKPTGYVVEPVETDEKLGDWKVTKRQSHEWQKLAAVPEDLFEQALAEPNASTSGIITRHEVAERGPVPAMDNHKALWLWGRLLDFEREMHGGDRRSGSRSDDVALNDLGISKKQSSDWQRLAASLDYALT